MPEARARGGGVGGFLIRRGAYPTPAVTGPRRVHSFLGEENKENIHWSVSGRGRVRSKKFPSRTPLRDITNIIHTMEWRRIHQQAAVVRLNLDVEASPQFPLLTSPLPQEPSVSDQTPSNQESLSDVSDISPNLIAAITLSPSPTEHLLQQETTSIPTSNFPTKHLPQISSIPTNLAPSVLKPTEPEKNLWNSIDEIETAVVEKLKRTTKEPAKKTTQRSTLLSMR